MYDGRTGAIPGVVLGHEPLGVVEHVGPAVETVTPGMRVVVPTHLYCGTCHMCARGLSASCLRARPEGLGAAYGYAGMGPYRGALAELLRVPWADANCIRVPGEPGDEHEDDFVLLADAFVTGWHATTLADVHPSHRDRTGHAGHGGDSPRPARGRAPPGRTARPARQRSRQGGRVPLTSARASCRCRDAAARGWRRSTVGRSAGGPVP